MTKQGGGFTSMVSGKRRVRFLRSYVTLHAEYSFRQQVEEGGREGEGERSGLRDIAFLGRQDVEGHLGPPSPLPCSVYGPIALLTVVVFCFLADSRRCDY